MSMFGAGQLTDGLGWGLSGRAGRSWNSVTVVGAAQTVNANGSLALSLCSWHTVSRANKGAAEMGTGVGSASRIRPRLCGCCQVEDSSLWPWPRMTDS